MNECDVQEGACACGAWHDELFPPRPKTPPGESSLGHLPGQKWEFDEAVARCCTDMMGRSVPGYDEMRELVTRLAVRVVPEKGTIVELGAANGDGIAQLARKRRDCRFYAVENAPAMLRRLRQRFAGMNHVRVVQRDLASLTTDPADRAIPKCYADLVLCVLTLQFVPPVARLARLAEAFSATKPGGTIVLVEKVALYHDRLRHVIEAEHHALKRRNGYSDAEIEAKVEALRGVLVPFSPESNLWLLREAGYLVEPFWQNLNFAGWIGYRP